MTSNLKALVTSRRKSNETTLGAFVFSPDANLSAIYAAAGFDFVVIDTEHGLNDVRTVEAHMRACRASSIVPIVRLGLANFTDAPRLLDAGVAGFMLPHCGLSDYGVDAVARSLRYPPLGTRPTCTGVPSANFGIGEFAAHAHRQNEEVLSIGLIEDAQVLDRLDAILDAREVDWLMPGPGDLASSMGLHGKLDHPNVRAAVTQVISRATSKRIPVGMYINDSREVEHWASRDVDFFVHSIDYKFLAKQLKLAEENCRNLYDAAHGMTR